LTAQIVTTLQVLQISSWTAIDVFIGFNFYRAMRSLERIVALLPWCLCVCLSICLSVWDGSAFWSYGAC